LAGIYIHIPFCKKACHYCDFHFSTTLNLVDDVVDSIALEAKRMKSYISEPIETIYFGGGTPSILNAKQLQKITESIFQHYTIKDSIEFTLEANPDDLTEGKIVFLKNIGVNRLSIGTQSFNENILAFLNRSHTAEQTLESVDLCQQHGISNLSLDLIYGIPEQSENQWKEDLKSMTQLNPTHISCYALTIEEKTVFGNWRKKGKILEPKDELVEEQYDFMVNYLQQKGYIHYEVSNFAKPTFISKHNSAYWHQNPYIGLGPGAHSFNGATRQFNISNNSKYIKLIKANQPPFTTEKLDKNELLTEYIFTKIRTYWGLDFNLMKQLFNYQLNNHQVEFINRIVSRKMATFVNNKLILNSKGFFISDSVVLELIP